MYVMFWKKIWGFLKSVWLKITGCQTSIKPNTLLDTVSLKLFGLNLKVTREVPVDVPYELTVIVPRAELHGGENNIDRNVILNSITIAHSPRVPNKPESEKTDIQKSVAA